MPRLTPVRKRALDEMMKEALYEAAVAVLAAHGAEGMTMDRVAEAAGMAKGSLYNYFRSKQDLVGFIHNKLVGPILEELTRNVSSDRPALEKLSLHLRAILEYVARHAQVFNLLFQDDTVAGLVESSERGAREAGSQLLAQIFRQGIDEGVFRPADPLVLARMFLGLCVGVFDSRPELERPEVRESMYALIMGTFLKGIALGKVHVG